MKTVTFMSCLAAQFQRFVDLRRLSGTDYRSQIVMLSYFDRFLADEDLRESRITREVTDSYQQTLTSLAVRTRSNRLSVVRQFCEYLSRKDSLSYVPDLPRLVPSRNTHRPYIYSETELRSLLRAAGELLPRNSLRPHTYRTLFGLLYSTGLRIGEALALNVEDLNCDEKMLHVREGKFRKARWLPLSDSCYRALRLYIDKRSEVSPSLADSPLLINLRRRRLYHGTVHHAFRDLLRQCGIGEKDSLPRIHDLRHTFAVHRLLEWYRQGEDLNARLPWLSTYMGHVDVSSTQVYLRATPELVEQVDRRFQRYFREKIKGQGCAL